LHENQFENLKRRLQAIDLVGKKKIPEHHLDRADRLEVADLVCHFHGEILLTYTFFLDPRLAYRDNIKERFQATQIENSLLGENDVSNYQYSKLHIVDHYWPEPQEMKKHEAMEKGWNDIRIQCCKTVEMLFKPDRNKQIPPIVVLEGAAGIGKTTMTRKIMLDWASGRLYQDLFDYAFYANCRELNLYTDDRKESIAEMISKQWPNKETINKILKNPKKLLFIIDGFDELRFSCDQPEDCLCTDPWQKEPVAVLLSSLFHKKVLPESYLIITTRPTALEKLGQCLKCSRFAEILGFSVKDRKKYFCKFFQNDDQAEKAFKVVEQNEALFRMCIIPLVCQIICTMMKQQMERHENLDQTSNTLTSVYMLYLSNLLKSNTQSMPHMQRNMQVLCSLAADGIWKRHIIFGEDDIQKHGLDKENPLPLFLSETIFRRDVDCVCTYYFLHLSFQEFFAALHYALEGGQALTSEGPKQDVIELLEGFASFRPDLELIVRFLFGLMNEGERMKDLKERFGWKTSFKIKELLLEWIRNATEPKMYMFEGIKNPWLECLHEIQEGLFVERALDRVTEVVTCRALSPKTEVLTVAYCLEHCSSLQVLQLEYHSFQMKRVKRKEEEEEEEEEELLMESQHLDCTQAQDPALFKALKSLKSNLRRVRLEYYCLAYDCCVPCGFLASLLSIYPTLSELDLGRSNLVDSALKLLVEGLNHPNCQLQKLELYSCNLTAACCKDLSLVLRTNQTLIYLDMSENALGNFGVHELCKGLKHPNCKLQRLKLAECSLTGACCWSLAGVLSKNQTLKELDLRFNKIQTIGIMLLRKGLKNPDCKLEELRLFKCNLTAECCAPLHSVLVSSQTLTKLDVTWNTLGDMGAKQLCLALMNPNCKLQGLREKYREYVREKYRSPEDGNPSCVVQVPPTEKYTKMIIASKKEREGEILNRPWRHTQLLSEQMPDTTIDVLFDTDNDGPQTVVLLGVAGVGKTTMTRKIMLDWATGKQFSERFDSVFYLSCRQMNLVVVEANLADLVLQNEPEFRLRESMNELLMNPGKCLFIIDGFEELSCSITQQEDLSPDPWERKPVGLLLSSLFHKTLLPESCLIITTRPNALESLESCLQSPCYVRHLGLSEEGKKEYFYRFFGEEELAVQALSYIQGNEALLAISFVPTVCGIICTVMKQQLDTAEEDLVPVSERLTAVYAIYLSHLAGSLCSGSEQLDLMRRLCSLAADGVWKKKSLFKEEELPNMLALCRTLFQKHPDCEGIYSFIHPTVQEFLAALFYVFEDISRNSETTKEDIKIFLDACSKGQGDLTLTVQFVFGLLNKEIMEYLKEQCEWKISSRIKADLLEWFQVDTQIQFSCPNYGQLERFHSLHEIREEEEFVKCALNHLTKLTLERLTFTQMDKATSEDRGTISNLLTLSNTEGSKLQNKESGDTYKICLRDCSLGVQRKSWTDRTASVSLCRLDGCQFTERCWADLSVVLSTSPALVELDLQMTNLKDSGVRLLCEGLIHPNCKLEKLGLWGCDLTHACSGNLSTVLSRSQKLTELKLGCNSSLGVQGVQLLCEGLEHPDCKLQSLELDECGLIAAGCQDLIPVLSTSKTLRKLNLERNKLGDTGVKLLCEALKHPQCQLQTLSLATCELGPGCCGDLSSVLSISQTLTELDLDYNQLEDSGVKLLCEGLKQPSCKLEKLGLCTTGITAAGCVELSSVLTTSQVLKDIDLWENPLEDSGLRLLCEGVKHPDCKLEVLSMWNCKFTAASCEDLCCVLSTNQSLKKLQLEHNKLGDAGVMLLCEGLKHPNCRLETIGLDTEELSEDTVRELSYLKRLKPELIIDT
ncbi:hypothetical protein JD844_022054, partial [Phrynosoma platyrhinos]